MYNSLQGFLTDLGIIEDTNGRIFLTCDSSRQFNYYSQTLFHPCLLAVLISEISNGPLVQVISL